MYKKTFITFLLITSSHHIFASESSYFAMQPSKQTTLDQQILMGNQEEKMFCNAGCCMGAISCCAGDFGTTAFCCTLAGACCLKMEYDRNNLIKKHQKKEK